MSGQISGLPSIEPGNPIGASQPNAISMRNGAENARSGAILEVRPQAAVDHFDACSDGAYGLNRGHCFNA
jgi:hypothetical protein